MLQMRACLPPARHVIGHCSWRCALPRAFLWIVELLVRIFSPSFHRWTPGFSPAPTVSIHNGGGECCSHGYPFYFSFQSISCISRSLRLNLKMYSERLWKISVVPFFFWDDPGNIKRAVNQNASQPLTEPCATGRLCLGRPMPIVWCWQFLQFWHF